MRIGLLKSRRLIWVAGLMAVLSFAPGCELNDNVGSDPADTTLSLVPSSVTVNRIGDDTVIFTVSDGVPPYSWSLSDTNGTYGTITAHDDTAIYMPTGTDGGLFLTVTDSRGLTATATITQK